jgi:hypothetical protein
MATAARKLIVEFAKHHVRIAELKKLLLADDVRKYYPNMTDENWLKFCREYPVEDDAEKKTKLVMDGVKISIEEKPSGDTKPAKKKAKVEAKVEA